MAIGERVDSGRLGSKQRQFVEKLDGFLDRLDLPGLDEAAIEVDLPRTGELSIVLSHRSEKDFDIRVSVSEGEASVSFAYDHLHFYAFDPEHGMRWPVDSSDHVAAAVAFTERLLLGKVEIEVRFRLFSTNTTTGASSREQEHFVVPIGASGDGARRSAPTSDLIRPRVRGAQARSPIGNETVNVLVAALVIAQAAIMYPVAFSLAPREQKASGTVQPPSGARSSNITVGGSLLLVLAGLVTLMVGGVRLSEFVGIAAFMWIPIAGTAVIVRKHWRDHVSENPAGSFELPTTATWRIAIAALALSLIAIALGNLVAAFLTR